MTSLSASGLVVNPYVDYRRICHLSAMKSALQRMFVKRLQEEMTARRLSANALARLCKASELDVGYATISRILSGKQDPTLQKVDALSSAIGLPSWFLFTESSQVEQRVIKPPTNVVRLPDPYPKIFGPKAPQPKAPLSGATTKQHSKKKR